MLGLCQALIQCEMHVDQAKHILHLWGILKASPEISVQLSVQPLPMLCRKREIGVSYKDMLKKRNFNTRLPGSFSSRCALLRASNASRASFPEFLSGCTNEESFLYAFEMSEESQGHDGLPSASKEGGGSSRSLQKYFHES